MSGTIIPKSPVRFSSMCGTHSTAEEVTDEKLYTVVGIEWLDPPNAPCASVKVFYRPRGESFMPFLQRS